MVFPPATFRGKCDGSAAMLVCYLILSIVLTAFACRWNNDSFDLMFKSPVRRAWGEAKP